MASVDIELEGRRPTEDERVIQWRLGELERAGYDQVNALELALAHDVDLHLATSLVRSGCPHETACRILL
jgi:hypothetical protein